MVPCISAKQRPRGNRLVSGRHTHRSEGPCRTSLIHTYPFHFPSPVGCWESVLGVSLLICPYLQWPVGICYWPHHKWAAQLGRLLVPIHCRDESGKVLGRSKSTLGAPMGDVMPKCSGSQEDTGMGLRTKLKCGKGTLTCASAQNFYPLSSREELRSPLLRTEPSCSLLLEMWLCHSSVAHPYTPQIPAMAAWPGRNLHSCLPSFSLRGQTM